MLTTIISSDDEHVIEDGDLSPKYNSGRESPFYEQGYSSPNNTSINNESEDIIEPRSDLLLSLENLNSTTLDDIISMNRQTLGDCPFLFNPKLSCLNLEQAAVACRLISRFSNEVYTNRMKDEADTNHRMAISELMNNENFCKDEAIRILKTRKDHVYLCKNIKETIRMEFKTWKSIEIPGRGSLFMIKDMEFRVMFLRYLEVHVLHCKEIPYKYKKAVSHFIRSLSVNEFLNNDEDYEYDYEYLSKSSLSLTEIYDTGIYSNKGFSFFDPSDLYQKTIHHIISLIRSQMSSKRVNRMAIIRYNQILISIDIKPMLILFNDKKTDSMVIINYFNENREHFHLFTRILKYFHWSFPNSIEFKPEEFYDQDLSELEGDLNDVIYQRDNAFNQRIYKEEHIDKERKEIINQILCLKHEIYMSKYSNANSRSITTNNYVHNGQHGNNSRRGNRKRKRKQNKKMSNTDFSGRRRLNNN